MCLGFPLRKRGIEGDFISIGIYGGTFDPIHFGHLRPIIEVLEQCKLEHIRVIPSSIPPHRDLPNTDIRQRLLLIKKALKDKKKLILDLREIEREGKSYTIDTLKSLRQSFPKRPLCLIVGLDAFLNLPHWYQWQDLLNYCHIIITLRPNCAYDPEKLPKKLKKLCQKHKTDEISSLHQNLYGKLHFVKVTQLDISATDIRTRIKNKKSVQFLLPNAVLNVIKRLKLYR